MPEILFLHKGGHAASTRYRALQYQACLYDAGWRLREMQVSGSLQQYRAALTAARGADAVVVLKKPFTPLFRYLLRRASGWLAFDFDDAVYVYDDGGSNPRRRAQFEAMLSLCDEAWAGNAELVRVAAAHARSTVLLPTTLPLEKYRVQGAKPVSGLELVWIGGSASRPWLESILPTLETAARMHPGLRLKIIADFSLHSEVLKIVAVPWSEASEARELGSAHIGIAPLPDNAFTRGKCGLKILQYMAAGLPVIASPTSVQSEMVEPGVTGLLASNEHGWVEAIRQLAGDRRLRRKMGQAGRQRCERRYGVDVGCQIMLERLGQALLTRRRD